MNHRELRIGNFVNIKHCEGYQNVYSINPTIGGYYTVNGFADVSGIPLTPEWLERFGWIWNEECGSYEKFPNGDVRLNLSFREVSQSYTMFNHVLKATIAERIWYVHQLQNLYFALTGEELTIK